MAISCRPAEEGAHSARPELRSSAQRDAVMPHSEAPERATSMASRHADLQTMPEPLSSFVNASAGNGESGNGANFPSAVWSWIPMAGVLLVQSGSLTNRMPLGSRRCRRGKRVYPATPAINRQPLLALVARPFTGLTATRWPPPAGANPFPPGGSP